jgi:hypothetical protein
MPDPTDKTKDRMPRSKAEEEDRAESERETLGRADTVEPERSAREHEHADGDDEEDAPDREPGGAIEPDDGDSELA